MLNNVPGKQRLVGIALLAALPAAADPPGARAPAFHDWRVDCTVAPLCAALTSVEAGGGREVLRLAVTRGEAASLAVTTDLPLYLPDGLVLALGARLERRVPWRTCSDRGCEATLPMDPELLEALRRERGGTATFSLVNGEEVRVPFSLMGFSAAFRALADPAAG